MLIVMAGGPKEPICFEQKLIQDAKAKHLISLFSEILNVTKM
jgi:hypothetical protein